MIQAALCRLIFLPFIIQKHSRCGFEIFIDLGDKEGINIKGIEAEKLFFYWTIRLRGKGCMEKMLWKTPVRFHYRTGAISLYHGFK